MREKKKRLPRKLKKRLKKNGIKQRKLYSSPQEFKGICLGTGWEAQLKGGAVTYKPNQVTIKGIEDLIEYLSK